MHDMNNGAAAVAVETEETEQGTPKCRMPNCPTEVFDPGWLCQACSAECFGTERDE